MTNPSDPSPRAPAAAPARPDAHAVVRPVPFDLSLQLVTPAEQDLLERGQTPSAFTFGGKAYELQWGADVIPGETDARGFVRKPGLDGNVERGALRVGARRTDGAFDESFTVPIEQVRTADREPRRELERQVALRLVNLGLLNTLDPAPTSLREAIACFLHRLPERAVDVPAQAGVAAWQARAVDYQEWPPDLTPLLRVVLARLRSACGEPGGTP